MITAVPYLSPLLFQLGFGLSAFHSGLLLLATAAGNLGMKLFSEMGEGGGSSDAVRRCTNNPTSVDLATSFAAPEWDGADWLRPSLDRRAEPGSPA